jgi:hypothetical protein
LESRVWGAKKVPQYRVRWDLPYGPESDSWEDAVELEECLAVDTFLALQDSTTEDPDHVPLRRGTRTRTSVK